LQQDSVTSDQQIYVNTNDLYHSSTSHSTSSSTEVDDHRYVESITSSASPLQKQLLLQKLQSQAFGSQPQLFPANALTQSHSASFGSSISTNFSATGAVVGAPGIPIDNSSDNNNRSKNSNLSTSLPNLQSEYLRNEVKDDICKSS
jgi:hypothetical protein